MFTGTDTIRAALPPLELRWLAADIAGNRHAFPIELVGGLPIALCGCPGGPNFNEDGSRDCEQCRSVLRLVLAGRISAAR